MYMGDVAFGCGDRVEARRQWELAVEKSPNAWQAYCSRADRYKKIGLIQEAIEDYERSFEIQKAPRLTDGLYSLVQIYEGMKDYKKAIETYERILKCLKEEHGQVFGTTEESCKKEIERLQKLAR
jgi:tetratricopeptide (TPR) repeat protein